MQVAQLQEHKANDGGSGRQLWNQWTIITDCSLENEQLKEICKLGSTDKDNYPDDINKGNMFFTS